MKTRLACCFRCPEFLGLGVGLLGLPAWKLVSQFLAVPATMLAALGVIGLLAGLAGAAASRRWADDRRTPGRHGAKAAVWAVIVAGAIFVLIARSLTGSGGLIKALMTAGASLLPSMFVGSIAAAVAAAILKLWGTKPDDHPPATEPPALLRWIFRGLIAALTLGAMASPFYASRGLSPLEAGRTPFSYTKPAALDTAPAVAWELHSQRLLGRFDPVAPIRLSKDERFIAGVASGAVVVQELDKENKRHLPNLPFPPAQVAFSPDGSRLFLVSASEPRRIAVVEIGTGRFLLPQPKNRAVPVGTIWWHGEKDVWFGESQGKTLALNLDTLLVDPVEVSVDEQKRFEAEVSPPMPRNDRWRFVFQSMVTSAELPETQGTRDWPVIEQDFLGLRDMKQAVTRAFPGIAVREGERAFGTSDGSKVLIQRGGELKAYYFKDRPIPSLRWKLTMPHGPEEMKEKDKTLRALARGELAAMLYRPMVNPLNQQTVGPERGEQPKAVLRFARWEGKEAELWAATDFEPQAAGDVIADIHVLGESRELLSCNQPHRWWTLCPEPMADAAAAEKVPAWSDLEKKRDVATAAERKAAEEAAAERARAAKASAPTSPSAPSAPAVPSGGPLVPPPDKNTQEIIAFVLAHHLKASDGKIEEFVTDYAERTDHLGDGLVSRDFIMKDEVEYHRKYTFLRERVANARVMVEPRAEPPFQVSYTMENEWQKIDGTSGTGTFNVRLVVDKIGGQWRITKHKAEKIK